MYLLASCLSLACAPSYLGTSTATAAYRGHGPRPYPARISPPAPAFTSRLHRTARKNEVHANDSGENRRLTKSVGTGMEEAILNCLEIAGRMVVRRAARIGLGIWMYLREKGKRKGKKRGRKGWN